MEDICDRQLSKRAGIALLSIAVLLAAMTQAAHVCPQIIPSRVAQANPPTTSGGPCLICLMAQPATAALLLRVILLSILSARPAALVEQRPRPLLATFRLCVRPPPA